MFTGLYKNIKIRCYIIANETTLHKRPNDTVINTERPVPSTLSISHTNMFTSNLYTLEILNLNRCIEY